MRLLGREPKENEMAKYYKYNGMKKTEITDVDSVAIVLDDGTEFELTFRRSDKDISLSASGPLALVPQASNVIRVRVAK